MYACTRYQPAGARVAWKVAERDKEIVLVRGVGTWGRHVGYCGRSLQNRVNFWSKDQSMHHRSSLLFALCSAALLACAGSESDADAGSHAAELTTNTTGADGCGCPAQQVEYVQQPLACACRRESGGLCPSTLDEAVGVMCRPGSRQPVIRIEGCGKVALVGTSGSVGGVQTFDVESGALIGVYTFFDIRFEPCNAFGYISGEAPFVGSGLRAGTSCPEADYCMACGTGAYPACAR